VPWGASIPSTIQEQLTETIHAHRTDVSKSEAIERAKEVLETVGIDPTRIKNYPHQLSGGMRQRVLLAMSLILEPELIIADEPTTGLDMLIRDQILEDLETYRDEFGISIIFVSHDIADLVETTDELVVMYGGKIVERGPSRDPSTTPRTPTPSDFGTRYPNSTRIRRTWSRWGWIRRTCGTRPGVSLRRQVPFDVEECHEAHPDYQETRPESTRRVTAPARRNRSGHTSRVRGGSMSDTTPEIEEESTTATESPGARTVLQVENLRKYYPASTGLLSGLIGERKYIKAVDDVSFTLGEQEVPRDHRGKWLGEVHPRRDHPPPGGPDRRIDPVQRPGVDGVLFERTPPVPRERPDHLPGSLRDAQPQKTVFQSVSEPLRNFRDLRHQELRDEVSETLHKVGLRPAETYIDSYPGQLSGGQRQRVNIARAIVLEPDLLIADEPVSMLDVSLQAGIIKMLRRLQEDIGFSMLYVSHNIPVVRLVADRIGVMYRGRLVEMGGAHDLVADPKHPTPTRSSRHADAERRARPVSLDDSESTEDAEMPSGCRFHPRCPEGNAGVFRAHARPRQRRRPRRRLLPPPRRGPARAERRLSAVRRNSFTERSVPFRCCSPATVER